MLKAVKGREALERVRTRATDLVIFDVFLSHKEGLKTIRTLRRQHPRLSMVAFSGGCPHIPQDFLPMAARLGARRTLRKPFGLEELRSVVEELLRGSG